MKAIRTWLDDHPREAPIVLGALAVLGVLVITQFVMPGDPGPAVGTPFAVVFRGFIFGFVTSLFAVGLVLMYRTMRFINFAQGVMGSIGATLISYLLVFTGIPFPIALLLGVAATGLFGAIVGVFLLRFFSGSRLFLTVVTITGTTFIFGSIIPWISDLPFWPGPDELSFGELGQLRDVGSLVPFGGWTFRVGDFPFDFGFKDILALELAALALAGIVVFLRFTRAGAAVRAMADNPERASLLGISVGSLAITVWAIAGVLDGVAAFSASVAAPGIGIGFEALLLPLAAAVIARFERFGVAVLASVLLGILRNAWFFSYQEYLNLFDLTVFALVAGALLLRGRSFSRADLGANVSWSATEEPRQIPAELKQVRGLMAARYGLWALGAILVGVYPYVFDLKRVVLGGNIFITAIAVLSLVVLTGWAGQVSLGQWALVGVGSLIGGWLTSVVGVPFWFAIPICVLLTAGVAVIVGLPALRVKGLFLMVITFAFAVAAQSVLFDDRFFGSMIPDVVDRPTLFFLNFEDERSMYFLCAAGLALAIVVVKNLRNSRTGRLLIAARENEANLSSFGVDVTRAKLSAFAVAGGLAGFAGILFAHQQRGVSALSFGADQSVQVFIQAVIGGVSSAGGALLGSAYFQLVNEFAASNAVLRPFVQGVIPLAILFLAPGGLISVVNSARDAVLRIVAQRRRIVVPSLFADYDPDTVERQLIPLGEESPLAGLAVVGNRRYAMASDLYVGDGERIADRMGPTKVAAESGAFAAAALAAEDDETLRARSADPEPASAADPDAPTPTGDGTDHEVVAVAAAAGEDHR